jgi:hypothetical protein
MLNKDIGADTAEGVAEEKERKKVSSKNEDV